MPERGVLLAPAPHEDELLAEIVLEVADIGVWRDFDLGAAREMAVADLQHDDAIGGRQFGCRSSICLVGHVLALLVLMVLPVVHPRMADSRRRCDLTDPVSTR